MSSPSSLILSGGPANGTGRSLGVVQQALLGLHYSLHDQCKLAEALTQGTFDTIEIELGSFEILLPSAHLVLEFRNCLADLRCHSVKRPSPGIRRKAAFQLVQDAGWRWLRFLWIRSVTLFNFLVFQTTAHTITALSVEPYNVVMAAY